MNNGLATRVEFGLIVLGVFLATFTSFRPQAILFTSSDLCFTLALAFRLSRGLVVRPLGNGTAFWLIGVVLVIGGLMIGAVFRGDVVRGLIVSCQYAYAYVIVPQLLAGHSYRNAILLMKSAVLGLAANSLTGVVAYYLGYSAGYGRHYVLVTGGGRVAGLVDNPNGLASMIGLTFPLLLLLAFQRAFRPAVAGFLMAFLFYTVILTSSNSGLFLSASGIFIFLFGLGKMRLLAVTTVFSIVAAVIVIQWGESYLPPTFVNRVLGAVESGDISEAGTFADRADLMVEAWSYLPENLIVGMGGDQYKYYSSSGIKVHNVYLLLANEGGIISLVGFVMILQSLIICCLTSRNAPHPHLTLVTMLSVVWAFAVFGMGTTHLYNRSLVIPFLLVAGLAHVERQDIRAMGRLRRDSFS